MDPEAEARNAPTHHRARDARGGEIILKSRRSRLFFVGALLALLVFAILVRLALLA